MATTTWPTLRQEAMQELDLGWLIANGDITLAVGSVTIVDPRVRNNNLSTNSMRNKGAVITRLGAASSADFYRQAGDLTASTGAIAVAPNYADTTLGTETIEIWFHGLIAGKEIQDAANRSLRDVFFDTKVALSHLSDLDGDMQASTDTNWTDVGTPTTSVKSTTARRTPYGLRSYNLVADAANEGTQSATLGITQGKQIKTFAISSANSGTFSHQPYDVTNSAAIGTAITHSEEEPQLTAIDWQAVPATCKEVALRLLGTVNPSDIFVNMVWLYKKDVLRVNFPAYVTEHFQAPFIEYGISTGETTATNTWNAQSLELRELHEGPSRDYTLQFHHPDSNPYGAIFRDASYFDYPLFIQARLPYSSETTFGAETTETKCPINLLKPRFKREMIDTVLLPRGIKRDATVFQRALSDDDWKKANAVRPVKQEARRPPFRVGKA